MTQRIVTAIECTCNRCGNRRVYEIPPTRCAGCKSASWDKPRKVKEWWQDVGEKPDTKGQTDSREGSGDFREQE